MKRKQTIVLVFMLLLGMLLMPLSVFAEDPANITITIHTNKDVDQLVMNSGMGEFLVTPHTEYSDEEQKGNNQAMDMNGDLKVDQTDYDILKAHVDGGCKDYTATVRCSHCGANDINGDGKIDQADLDMLKSHLDGKCQLADCYFHGTRINREIDPDDPNKYIWAFIYTPTIAGTDNITFKPQSMTTTGTRTGATKAVEIKAEEYKNPEIIKSWTDPKQDKYLINSTVELFAVTPLETDQVTFTTVQGTFVIKAPDSINYDKCEKTWKKTLVVNQAGVQNFTVTAQGEQSNNTYKSTKTPFKYTERIVDPKVTSTNRNVQTHSYSWTTSTTDAEGNVSTSTHTTYWYTITVTAVANADTDYVVFNTPGGQVTATTYYQSGNNRNFSTSWTSSSSGDSASSSAFATIGEKPVVKYSYIVTFDPQNGSNMAPVTVEYDKKISKPTDPVRYGFTFGGWFREARCINSWNFGADTIRSTTVLYAKWTRNNYTMTFNPNGGSTMMPKSVPYDSTFNSPGEPTRTGYLFGGWYKDAGCTAIWDFSSDKVQKDTTLYAKWIPIPYKVNFNSMGGNDIPARAINYDSLITSPPTPTLTGYAFAGWYKDINLTQPWNMGSDRVKTAMMLYAKWTVGQYDVNFNSQGGSAVTKATVNHNAVVPKPTNPTRSGYTFGGWFKEATCTNPWRYDAFTLTAPMTLYAKWTADKSNLVFDSKGGSGVDTKAGVTDGIITPTTLPTTTRSGYTFGGWYDNAAYNGSALTKLPDKYPVGTVTYYARWHAIAATFVFNANGGSAIADKTGVTDAAVSPTTLPTTTRAGFEFGGWYLTPDFTTSVLTQLPETYPVGITTLNAKWVAQKAYIIFNSNGGDYVAKMIGNTDDAISPTTMPTISRGGYTFAGWFNNSGLTGGTVTAKPNKYPAGTTEYWAKWTAKASTIQFDTMGGNPVADKVGVTDQTISPTTMPTATRSGYTFTGWYTQSDYNTVKTTNLPSKYPIDGITYYAKWSANTATIEFNTNGGSSVTKMVGVTDRPIYNTDLPINLTKTGFTFDGWYDNAALLGTKLTKLPDIYPTGTTIYYAKWVAKP